MERLLVPGKDMEYNVMRLEETQAIILRDTRSIIREMRSTFTNFVTLEETFYN